MTGKDDDNDDDYDDDYKQPEQKSILGSLSFYG